ncbi:DUF4767 domain-containing protein [Enterococcus sp. 669A]|uniref:DUF4767 domain-containing protein n=1 Tax=Candidatus Enterococcus moelleringii TaxID=2815325 RepID=A0ABS3L7M7_9ENTE|nr:DUF4767 domain-containing protein [Enterococcus sp. 669A]MBO1304756.1 DUF4767 domain-containing protein [Enterococcus sp. 669A]
MMKIKKKMMYLTILGAVFLSGCSPKKEAQKTAENHSTSSSQAVAESSTTEENTGQASNVTSSSSSTTQESSTEPVQTTLWNPEKAQQLDQFMASWGQTMGQEYRAYGKGNSVKHYVFQVPDHILSGEVAFFVNEQQTEMSWSEDGESGQGYQAVAVYSDFDTGEPGMGKHCYLFAFYNGEPRVLICELTGYYETRAAKFKDTENQDLKNGFAQIVNNSPVQISEQPEAAAAPISYEEAKSLLLREQLPFSDASGHLVNKGDIPGISDGGNYLILDNGSVMLRQYSGAKGFEEYTLTPNADGTVRIMWESFTIEDLNKRSTGIPKDVVVPR